jgi:hypothetical protein
MPSVNKKRGNLWEYAVRDILQQFFTKKIITTREGSRALDNQKIDLMFEDGITLPFSPQCKSSLSFSWNWLEEISGDGIIFWKRMVKVNTKQKCLGKYVIMEMETFEKLMKK